MAKVQTATPRRSRSTDRRDQIVAVATKLFGQRGYHAVSLQEIGDQVGLDASSLYFHFPNKEAILVAVIESIIGSFEDRIDEVMATPGSAEEHLTVLTEDSLRRSVLNRHYFMATPADLRLVPASLVRELQLKGKAAARPGVEALRTLHPELTFPEAELIINATGCLPISLQHYRPELPKQDLIALLGRMALGAMFVPAFRERIDAVEVTLQRGPEPAKQNHRREPTVYDRTASSAREQVLAAALGLFRAGGFDGVGVDDLARALGITGPGVYRHFESKEEILYTLLTRAVGELATSVRRSFTKASSARDALDRLITRTVELALEDADLLAVFWTQRDSLAKDSRLLVTRELRGYVKDWMGVLGDVRPELSEAQARTMVYGALWLVNAYWWHNSKLPPDQAGPLLRSITTSALLSA